MVNGCLWGEYVCMGTFMCKNVLEEVAGELLVNFYHSEVQFSLRIDFTTHQRVYKFIHSKCTEWLMCKMLGEVHG